MRLFCAALPVALSLACLPMPAQDRKGVNDNTYYEVKFTLQDAAAPAGKNTQTFSLITAANRKATFRVGDRVPLITTSYQAGAGGSAPVLGTNFSYADVGATIECTVADIGAKFSLHGLIDLSAVDTEKPKNPNPILGETKLELETAVDPGRPTIIATIDDPLHSHKLQVEATVTKLP